MAEWCGMLCGYELGGVSFDCARCASLRMTEFGWGKDSGESKGNGLAQRRRHSDEARWGLRFVFLQVRLALEKFGQGCAGSSVFDDRDRFYVHELCPEGRDLVHRFGGF